MSNRKLTDWISNFELLMEPTETPRPFIKWCAISAISSILGRRSFIRKGRHICFPNQFIMLVSPPGVGKSSAISEVKSMLRRVKRINLTPDKMTRAALEDFCMKVSEDPNKYELNPVNEMIEPTTSTVLVNDELGVLMSEYSTDLSTFLTKLWDCEPVYTSAIRTNNINVELNNLCLNMLVGAQPKLMAHVLPETSQGQGFMTRVLLIYADKGRKVSMWEEIEINSVLENNLMHDLHDISRMRGRFMVSPEARQITEEWEQTKPEPFEPVPQHPKLQDYKHRRLQHVLKLGMAFSASRGNDMVILPCDFENAIRTLVEAEHEMPAIFAEMGSKGYGDAMEDLFMTMLEMQRKNGGQPIHEAMLRRFLSDRVPAHQIEYSLQQMIKMGMIEFKGAHHALNGMAKLVPVQTYHSAKIRMAIEEVRENG